jgi:hypothetical protein
VPTVAAWGVALAGRAGEEAALGDRRRRREVLQRQAVVRDDEPQREEATRILWGG